MMRTKRLLLLIMFIPTWLHAQNSANHTEVQDAVEKLMTGTTNGVTMDLDSLLLSAAARSMSGFELLDDGGAAKKVIGNLRSIQLRMFDLEGDVLQKTQPVRELLKSPRWVRYVASSSGDNHVEIWAGRDGDKQTGVLLLSINGKRVFSMNVIGDIRPDELVYLSGRLGLPPIADKVRLRLDSPPAAPTPPVPPARPAVPRNAAQPGTQRGTQ